MELQYVDIEGEVRDDIFYIWEPLGMFSIKTVYDMLMGYSDVMQRTFWSTLWKIKVANKIKTLIQIVVHKRVLGNVERK